MVSDKIAAACALAGCPLSVVQYLAIIDLEMSGFKDEQREEKQERVEKLIRKGEIIRTIK